MTEHDDIDRRLAALFAEAEPPADPLFADRLVALAAFQLAVRRHRQRAVWQVGREALALAAVLGSFVLLALRDPAGAMPADFGDALPLGSPAMLGVIVLALWGLTGLRERAAA